VSWRKSLDLLSPDERHARRSALSELTNPARYDDPLWVEFHRDLESYATDKLVFRHVVGEVVRKSYEWTQCIYGLALLDTLKPDARALGVGAGHEPVIFWLADQIGHVTATDLYGNETWENSPGAEGSAGVFDAPEQYCARPFASEKISFQSADGTKLPFADDSFDVCWSLSSIEHFGGHEAAAVAMREMARVTKPGGVVCVASEVLLRHEKNHAEFFSRQQFLKHVLRASGDLGLIGRMDWQKPPQEYLDDPVILWGEAGRSRRHVVMQDGSYQWTSAIAFLRKGAPRAAASLDYARVILPPGTRPSARPQAYALPYFRPLNGARADLVAPTVRLTTPDQPWSYAVEFPLLADRAAVESVDVELAVRATGKAVCIGLLGSDGSTFIQEVEVKPDAEFKPVKLSAAKGQPIGSLMVRSSANGGGAAEIEFRSCQTRMKQRPG
jgi:SAM-dependent methyltransferase